MQQKITVVIPTLQKNKDLLINLISTIEKDQNVGEIIVIDNSLQGLNVNCSKLRLITPKENLYVNPSWNLGTKEAKFENVALLNDDITIPDDFCSSVFEKMPDDAGISGFNVDFIKESQDIVAKPQKTNVYFTNMISRNLHWGVAIFFKKSNYAQIPEDLKIFCGDDWLVYQAKKNKKRVYSICGQEIYHWGSLSSGIKTLNEIAKNDKKLYKKLTRKWWNYIFNFELVYRGFRITLFGVDFLYHWDKKH